MSVHAEFAPSAAERWLACPGSHLRAKALPPLPPTSYSERGVLLHELAAYGVANGVPALARKLAVESVVQVIEDDEKLALSLYITFCRKWRGNAQAWGVEAEVHYSDALFGTVDFWALQEGTLHIVDFKTGRGVYVEAHDNAQMLLYARLVLHNLPPPLFDAVHEVQLHVVQPLFEGTDPIRSSGAYTREEIIAGFIRVQDAMRAAREPDAPLVPGDHCRFCPVKPACPALLGLVQHTADTPPRDIEALTPDALSLWLQKADLVETWIGALRERAHQLATSGTLIPGWKLVDKRATRKWSDEARVLAQAKALGIHAQELQLLSPAQLEKKLGELPPKIAALVERKPSGQNLVRDPSTDGLRSDGAKPVLDTALRNMKYRV